MLIPSKDDPGTPTIRTGAMARVGFGGAGGAAGAVGVDRVARVDREMGLESETEPGVA